MFPLDFFFKITIVVAQTKYNNMNTLRSWIDSVLSILTSGLIITGAVVATIVAVGFVVLVVLLIGMVFAILAIVDFIQDAFSKCKDHFSIWSICDHKSRIASSLYGFFPKKKKKREVRLRNSFLFLRSDHSLFSIDLFDFLELDENFISDIKIFFPFDTFRCFDEFFV